MSERCLVEITKHNNRARAFLRAATRSNRHTAGTSTSRADNFEPTSTTRRLQRAELAWRQHNKQRSTAFFTKPPSISFADWLEEHDPYLAWLRTTAPHLHTRSSSRGPRPSQVINTTLERSPVNTRKHKAFPSQLPCPRDNFDKDTDIICDGGAAIFCSPKPEHFIESTLKPTLQQLIGVDDIPHPAAMEGFAQICWADPKQKIMVHFEIINASLNVAVNSAVQARDDHVPAGLAACSALGGDFGEKAGLRRRVGVLPVTTRVPARVMITTEPRCEFQRRLSRNKWNFWTLYLPRAAPRPG